MTIDIERVADIVSLKLGEYPDWRRRRDSPGAGASLDVMIEPIVEEVALMEALAADLGSFRDLRDFRLDVYTNADYGNDAYGEYELPEDFLRLAAFRMGGWPRMLNEELPGDAQRCALGEGAPDWLRERARRPWIEVLPLGEGKVLRFGPFRGRFPTVASYVPRPRYDAKTRQLTGVDPTQLIGIAERLAAFIAG